MAGFGVLRETEATLFAAFGESIIGKGGSNNFKGWTILSSLAKIVDDFGDFNEASRP